MKLFTFILFSIFFITSCKKKEEDKFIVNLKYYSSTIEFDRIDNFDTLVSWKWMNDNAASHRQCYRIQNSKLGIKMENGMLPEKAEYFDQMTIQTPFGKNTMDSFSAETISEHLTGIKDLYLFERPSDKIFKFDSLTIDGRKFGVFGIKRLFDTQSRDVHTKIIFMTNLNNNVLGFEFYTNIYPADKFYLKSLKMINTIKIKHYR